MCAGCSGREMCNGGIQCSLYSGMAEVGSNVHSKGADSESCSYCTRPYGAIAALSPSSYSEYDRNNFRLS